MGRRALPHLVALVLGIGAALLAACGSSTRGGIPEADGSGIKGQLEDVRSRVSDGNCEGLARELREVNTAIDQLPRSVDNRLVSALRDGADRLQSRAVQECNDNSTPVQTETTPPETTTQPPPETTPTQTETTPPETTTTPPETTTQPPTFTVAPEPPPEPAPAPAPPPPVVSPGGGTPPTVP